VGSTLYVNHSCFNYVYHHPSMSSEVRSTLQSHRDQHYQEGNVSFKDKLLMKSIEEKRQAISFHWVVAHCWKGATERWQGTHIREIQHGLLSEEINIKWIILIRHISRQQDQVNVNNTTMVVLWKSKVEIQKILEQGYSSEHLRVLNLQNVKGDPFLNKKEWFQLIWQLESQSRMRKPKLNRMHGNHQVR
jgi:hypothetical protein